MGLRSPGVEHFGIQSRLSVPVCGRPSARLELDGNARALDLYQVCQGTLGCQRYRGAVTNQWVYTVTHQGHRGLHQAILNAGEIFPLAILAKIERFLSLLAISAKPA